MAQSARLLELQERAAALRTELQAVESAIEQEEVLLQAPNVALHHRPSYSLFGAGDEALESPVAPVIRQLSTRDQDFETVLKDHPKLEIAPIGAFNHWDRRECAVQNGADWKARCQKYVESLGGLAEIPKVIHQIWIGPREPPCLWIDTFRVEYLAAHPGWGYELWSDEKVAKLPMFNEQIYTEEKMWQCKADILRLEFLWHHGGMYVDADMISVDMKPLDSILELGKQTGWVIAYEPDTKDKPYSILGNSVIACTPHHPLTLMLILYLKQTFHHKRHVIDVFAVTGPVMYTKCLVDCGMPISIADQALLYPAFHFVPNPDAINFANFPKCLMFQFGYTCSGLEGYVKSKNRCKKARMCPYHAQKDWPLGGFRELPSVEQVEQQFGAQASKAVPNVIHQLVFAGVDGNSDPVRWRQTWWEGFKAGHPEFEYRTWSKEQLLGQKWFCANLYVEPLDDHAVTALMLEVLFNHGGYYVPLSTTCSVGPGRDPFFAAAGADFAEGSGGVCRVAKGSPGCFRRLLELYEKGHVEPMLGPSTSGPRVVTMGFRDGAISKATFTTDTKYLGAAQVVACTGDSRMETFAISWAYSCMVPCLCAKGNSSMLAALGEGGLSSTAVFLTDREILQMDRLRGEMPGILDRLPQGWEVLLLGIEWSTGSEEVVSFNVPPGGRPRNSKVTGFVANFTGFAQKKDLQAALQACITEEGFDPTPLFNAAGRLSLWFAAEKYAGSIEEARIWRSMPLVSRCFNHLARHSPPLDTDRQEIHGNLMKGWHHGRLRFETILEPNGGIMFRCWNDDNSTNCEMKSNGSAVEWMKVYCNHQVSFQEQNKPIP